MGFFAWFLLIGTGLTYFGMPKEVKYSIFKLSFVILPDRVIFYHLFLKKIS